jgi:hypothetical protein
MNVVVTETGDAAQVRVFRAKSRLTASGSMVSALCGIVPARLEQPLFSAPAETVTSGTSNQWCTRGRVATLY